MKNSPFFSIIIPTYNRSDIIEKTLQSVLNQTFENFELIIVDDGSTDDTKETVSNIFDKRLIYFKIENRERGAARNEGTKITRGKYVTFLDSDDLLLPTHFEEAYKFIRNHHPIIFHQQYQIVSQHNTKKIKLSESISKALLRGNPLSCIGVFIKRKFAVKNLFIEDRKLSGTEDYELWLRYAAKYPFLYNPVCTSSLIIHEDRSVFNFNEKELLNRRDLLLKELKNNPSFILKYKTKGLKRIESNMNTYVALHLALSKSNNKLVIKYFLAGVKGSVQELFSRRTLAIIKRLL